MNIKHLFITAGAIFLFALLWNGLVHMWILQDANLALAAIARAAGERSLLLSLLLTAALAMLFSWSYARCAKRGGIREGLGHGLFFALLAGVLVDLNQYIVYPLPVSLAAKWFAFGVVEFCVYGLLAGLLYPVQQRRYGKEPDKNSDFRQP